MKIAQVAPLYESVPPKLYGGTERVVYNLTEELVRMGHEVTLFASGDSKTSARLRPMRAAATRLDGSCLDEMSSHLLMMERVAQEAAEYDVVHFHVDYIHFPLVRRLNFPSITTLHGRLDLPDLAELYREFDDIPVVSISNDQRKPIPFANWAGTVYHGLPPSQYTPGGRRNGFLAFLGRISPEKGVDAAIDIARRAGWPLKIAAKIGDQDRRYFHDVIEPLLGQPGIDFIGEVDERGKERLLREAAGLLFPIDWPEPFGLVMIEAMACGTPVIGYRRGSVPEILEDGVTGFVVSSPEEAVAAIQRLKDLDSGRIRQEFERRFTADRMARDYVAIYERIASRTGEVNAVTTDGRLAAV